MKRLALGLMVSASICMAADKTPTDAERAGWTLGDMRTLATAIEAYAVDHDEYPKVASFDQIVPLIQPIYIRRAPIRDAWGNAYVYAPSADGKSYRLVSPGSDGTTDPGTWDVQGELSGYAADAVMDSGKFRRAWMYR